jgi:hypothetical protein
MAVYARSKAGYFQRTPQVSLSFDTLLPDGDDALRISVDTKDVNFTTCYFPKPPQDMKPYWIHVIVIILGSLFLLYNG